MDEPDKPDDPAPSVPSGEEGSREETKYFVRFHGKVLVGPMTREELRRRFPDMDSDAGKA